MDNDRLKHSISVARKMVEIGKNYNLKEEELNKLFLLGYLHDIGYEFNDKTLEHNKLGGNILKENNYPFYNEVYYHGEITDEYSSLYLDILNSADMQIDKYGNDVGYEKRLNDIKERYGSSSLIYNKCKKLVNILKDKKDYYEK